MIKYIDSLEVGPDHLFLATESVVPLRNVLHTLEYSEVLLGLNQIAVCFFHIWSFFVVIRSIVVRVS